ncbi:MULTISPECIES: AraC family transcriptional regulator [Bacillus cereus group]|uniref:AraC family transcriptional regulator n=1 Tax=Bacillus thuringiensis serovar toumanoffi TaxID=180862 RepID=A0ABD5I943_BACTU|nr:AraC family transcriptional regulator [Bacillus thuringiensis]AMR88549.1 AraC family transcriptional regulator [Bacillus thuringiensis]EEM92895.1 Helix-turn-helix-domain containing protein AraC type [Bacillus thuringiensis IBL 200]KIP23156.1 helix-turn-helix domain protein [Bacillus thuringiensis serovar morrisoni]MBG9640454.1 AraC family transcriptional regulator [Bacillus thuringiensis]MBG9676396.1 AraC family transcriptional regulator [Bacillus thuringiensis]
MNKADHSVNKEYICQLLFQTFEIPVRFCDKNKKILHENVSSDIPNPFYSSKVEHLNELYMDDDPFNFPIIRTNNFLESFILIHLNIQENTEGAFIIGPCIFSKPLEKMINRIINDCHVIANKHKVMNYYHSIPVIKKSNLIHVSILLYYMIYFKKIDVKTVEKRNNFLNTMSREVKNPGLFISACHQNDHARNEVSVSTKMFEAIKAGNLEEVLKHLKAFPYEKVGVLCLTSELRNRKNQAITGIAIASRYAIEGGLPSEIAFALGDLYIQSLEKLNKINSILDLIQEAFCTFTEHVKAHRGKNHSKPIITCQNYISKSIYQEISLKQLACITNKNSMYLSTLFKKEVGMTISEYIHREKVEEAKKLLTLTDYSLLEISTFLNFNNQSYFTKIFKKYTEVTPKLYRNQYTIY